MDYMNIEPVILVGIINTKLRNNYSNLDSLCYNLDLEKEKLIDKLGEKNFIYDELHNQFK